MCLPRGLGRICMRCGWARFVWIGGRDRSKGVGLEVSVASVTQRRVPSEARGEEEGKVGDRQTFVRASERERALIERREHTLERRAPGRFECAAGHEAVVGRSRARVSLRRRRNGVPLRARVSDSPRVNAERGFVSGFRCVTTKSRDARRRHPCSGGAAASFKVSRRHTGHCTSDEFQPQKRNEKSATARSFFEGVGGQPTISEKINRLRRSGRSSGQSVKYLTNGLAMGDSQRNASQAIISDAVGSMRIRSSTMISIGDRHERHATPR